MSTTPPRTHKSVNPLSPRRKRRTRTPRQHYEALVSQPKHHLSSDVYKHPEMDEIAKPFEQLWGFLNNRISAFNGTQAYTEALHDIVEQVGSLKGVMTSALFPKGKKGGVEGGRTSWPLTPREYWTLMVHFSRRVHSVCHFVSLDFHVVRWKLALRDLHVQVHDHKVLTQDLHKLNDAAKSNMKKYRIQTRFLIATHRIVMSRNLMELTQDELKALVDSRKEFLYCQVYSLPDLNTNHNCPTCTANSTKPVLPPKYPPPADGSGTPQIAGLFPSGPVSLEDLDEHHFRYVTGGTTCGMINTPGETAPELALFIHFIDFHAQSADRRARLERLAALLHLGAWFGTPCTSNAAHQAIPSKLRGKMVVLGMRKARDEIPFGLYAIPPRFKKGIARKEWFDFQEECMPEIAVIMNKLFEESIASLVTKNAQDFVGKFNLPPFGTTSIDPKDWKPSAGVNSTISFGGFSNEAHLDKDKYRYVFSTYVFVDRDTGELITDPERIAGCMEGGCLIWPDLHLALKIVHCSGVVILLWRGTHERHCTITSKILDSSIVRYGTSLQVNEKLFKSVQSYHEKLEAIERWELAGCKGTCPNFPALPTDLNDLYVHH
ncbi:hypothetical protein FS749_016675 [Ceratobasidium sp. UAMH 11750]|nr:hypothetical protein FS749_016675 [Ceratobasidium sp. UAMH 11750]